MNQLATDYKFTPVTLLDAQTATLLLNDTGQTTKQTTWQYKMQVLQYNQ